jgi:hypothetical protein
MHAAGEHALSINLEILVPDRVYLFLWCFPDFLLWFFILNQDHVLENYAFTNYRSFKFPNQISC